MEKLKNLLKSDTPTDDNEQHSATGKITGQGSHFPASDAGPTQAAYTAGPEAGGNSHIGTVGAASTAPAASQTSNVGNEASSYNVTNADFPTTESSADGSGTAAIGQTSTYSSSPLSKGDPVSSVIDPDSKDPLTYKKPESGAGAGPGAAAAAATAAFTSDQERRATEIAGHENPYRASSLDPRVDGQPKSSGPIDTSTATTGASAAYTAHETPATAPAQSTLTTTIDPADRSAEYGQSTETKGLDTADSAQTSNVASDTTTGDVERKPSVLDKVLGAVGLGGATGVIGSKVAGSDEKEESAVDTSQPVTTTGVDSYTSPTVSGPGIAHRRKESIPTTAYPAGVDSPTAINAPVGGTRPSRDESAVASGAPTGGYVATDIPIGRYDTSETTQPGTTTGLSSIHHATTTGPSTTAEATSAPSASTGDTAVARESAKEEDHTGRNIATGIAAGAAVGGAGAYGAHEFSKKETEQAEAAQAKAEAAREKELEAQQKAAEKEAAHQREVAAKEAADREKAHQKEIEKEQKAHQKAVEKEEKAHQKELEKEEKKAQKEAEKEQKQHDKEVAALEKKHEKEEKKHQEQLEKEQAEEERRRREAAAAAAATTGGAAAAYEGDKEAEQKEKKPSIFKRIFKRRKNEQTGEDEDYSTDEEDHSRGTAIAGGTAVAGGTAGAAYATREADPSTASTGYVQPERTADPLASTQSASETGAKGYVATGPDGQPAYTVVPQATQSGPADQTTPMTASHVAGEDPRPREPITGLPYDPAKDPKTAEVLAQHQTPSTAAAATTSADGKPSLEERLEAMQGEQFGVIEDSRR